MEHRNPALEILPTVDRLLDMSERRRHDTYLEVAGAVTDLIAKAHVDDHFLDGPQAPHTRAVAVAQTCRDALMARYIGYPEVLTDMLMAICVGTALADDAPHRIDRERGL